MIKSPADVVAPPGYSASCARAHYRASSPERRGAAPERRAHPVNRKHSHHDLCPPPEKMRRVGIFAPSSSGVLVRERPTPAIARLAVRTGSVLIEKGAEGRDGPHVGALRPSRRDDVAG